MSFAKAAGRVLTGAVLDVARGVCPACGGPFPREAKAGATTRAKKAATGAGKEVVIDVARGSYRIA